MTFNTIIIHFHSILRWLILVFMLMSVINAIIQLNRKNITLNNVMIFSRLSFISAHIQLLLGFVLYFISNKVVFDAMSMKNAVQRFFLVEHGLIMLIAIALITIGYVKSKRAIDNRKKIKFLLIYYSISLILILIAIPWPFRGLGGQWF